MSTDARWAYARRTASMLVPSIYAIAISGTVGAAEAGYGAEICPREMRGKFSAGPYHFQYQSWSWKNEASGSSSLPSAAHSLCHCVRNESERAALFVNWEQTGLRMFLGPSQAAYVQYSNADGATAARKVPLWYGARPDKLDAETVFSAVDGAAATAQDRNEQKLSELKTSSSTAVPDLGSIARIIGTNPKAMKFSDVVSAVEKNPRVLMPMYMEFTSTPMTDNKSGELTVENMCRYRIEAIENNSSAPILKMKLSDASLHASVFQSPDAIPITTRWTHGTPMFRGVVSMPARASVGLQSATAELQILDVDEKMVLSSIPVRYYALKPQAYGRAAQ